MNRSTTIVIATLMNVALLAFLFSTSQFKRSVTEPKIIQHVEQKTVTLEEAVVLPEKVEATPYHMIVVKQGDQLDKIAKNYAVHVSTLIELNQLTSEQLKVGQMLKIPHQAEMITPEVKADKVVDKITEKEVERTPKESREYYVVKEGDNPWIIASKHHLRLEKFLELNGLDEKKARHLKPGDKLRIK